MDAEYCIETPNIGSQLSNWCAAVDFFKGKMAGKNVVFIADGACNQALRVYLSQAKLPMHFAVFYGHAVKVSKSILTQRIRAADWLIIDAEAEYLLKNAGELIAESAAVKVLVAEKLMKPNCNFDFCVCPNYDVDGNPGGYIRMAIEEKSEDVSVHFIAEGITLVNTSAPRLNYLKQQIAHTYAKRAQLKAEMEAWYQAGKGLRFPKRLELESIDRYLSQLDTAYKRLWDANQ